MFLSGSPRKDRRRIRLQMLIERATLNKSKMPDERERERKGENENKAIDLWRRLKNKKVRK